MLGWAVLKKACPCCVYRQPVSCLSASDTMPTTTKTTTTRAGQHHAQAQASVVSSLLRAGVVVETILVVSPGGTVTDHPCCKSQNGLTLVAWEWHIFAARGIFWFPLPLFPSFSQPAKTCGVCASRHPTKFADYLYVLYLRLANIREYPASQPANGFNFPLQAQAVATCTIPSSPRFYLEFRPSVSPTLMHLFNHPPARF
ncbi:hypothetical protein HDK77DRAFT_300511 [Phyllosticta capitalensis]